MPNVLSAFFFVTSLIIRVALNFNSIALNNILKNDTESMNK